MEIKTRELIHWITTVEHNQWLLNRWDAGDRQILTDDGVSATGEWISAMRQRVTEALPMIDDYRAELYRRWLGGVL